MKISTKLFAVPLAATAAIAMAGEVSAHGVGSPLPILHSLPRPNPQFFNVRVTNLDVLRLTGYFNKPFRPFLYYANHAPFQEYLARRNGTAFLRFRTRPAFVVAPRQRLTAAEIFNKVVNKP